MIKQEFIFLRSYRRKNINAYLVREGLDYTHNDYGHPATEEDEQRAYRGKSHTVKVRISHLTNGIYRYVEAGGADGVRITKGYLKIVNGEIEQESENINDLIIDKKVTQELPDLEGSVAQVKWAMDLRDKVIALAIKQGKEIPAWVFTQTSSKFYIDRK